MLEEGFEKSVSVQLYTAQYDSEDVCDFIWKKTAMSKLKNAAGGEGNVNYN